jgi:hypothetical protein
MHGAACFVVICQRKAACQQSSYQGKSNFLLRHTGPFVGVNQLMGLSSRRRHKRPHLIYLLLQMPAKHHLAV